MVAEIKGIELQSAATVQRVEGIDANVIPRVPPRAVTILAAPPQKAPYVPKRESYTLTGINTPQVTQTIPEGVSYI